jgi:hypothetical protein
MGNVDSRAKQDNGYLYIQCDHQTYFPGEDVTGVIYMRVTKAFDAHNVEIEVKGAEKSKWTEEVHKQEEVDGEMRMTTEHIKNKDSHHIYSFKGPCF